MGISDFAINIGESHEQVVQITIFVAVLCFCLVIGHLLGESRWVNESITALIIGCVTGTIILLISKWKSSYLLRFNKELFFIYLIPPIIFNAGSKKQFFHNFFTIMLFGVVGVFMSSSIITTGSWLLFPKFGFAGLTARDYLGTGIIYSSTDTVCTLQAILLMAYILKGLYFGRHSTVHEIALMVLMVYLSYMLAEFKMLAVFPSFLSVILHVFATMPVIAETFIFLYLGMDDLDIEKWKMSKLSVVLSVMLGRAAFVFPRSVLSHCMSRTATRSSSITFKHQIIIWWAGLMRGAVSIALAFKQFTHYGVSLDQVNALVTPTVIVVLFSTIVFGVLTKPLVNYLLPHNDTSYIDREPSILKEDMKLPLLSFDKSAATKLLRAKDSLLMLIERPVYTIHSFWRRFA